MRKDSPVAVEGLVRPEHIRTDRLLLRRLEPEPDFEAVHAYASDPEVTRYMDWGPNAPDGTRSFLAMAALGAGSDWEFAICDLGSNTLLGAAGIHFLAPGCAEIGYCLAKHAWGRGVATEAASALVKLGFSVGMHRVQARCDPENTASARVLAKVGMRLEGHMRGCVQVRGEWRDRLIFGILRPDWVAVE